VSEIFVIEAKYLFFFILLRRVSLPSLDYGARNSCSYSALFLLRRFCCGMANASRVYRFQVLLPSGVSSMLTLHDPGYEISVSDLLLKVKGEVGNTHWDVNGKVYLTDLLDGIITDKIMLSNFDTKSVNILKLHVSP